MAISSLNIGLHALGTIRLDRTVQRYWGEELQEHPMRERFLLMIVVGTALMVAHVLEVLVWDLLLRSSRRLSSRHRRGLFRPCAIHDARPRRGGAAPRLDAARAHRRSQWLLLFGWSTAVIFEVVRTTIPGLRT
jgi:hypothetical protein